MDTWILCYILAYFIFLELIIGTIVFWTKDISSKTVKQRYYFHQQRRNCHHLGQGEIPNHCLLSCVMTFALVNKPLSEKSVFCLRKF